MAKNPSMQKPRAKKGTLLRVIKLLYTSFPVLMPLVTVAAIFTSVVSSIPALFQQRILAIIEANFKDRNWDAAFPEILSNVIPLALCYILSIALLILNTQLFAVITQGFLSKLRVKMFEKMQDLPVRYFDRNKHGDIMSHYTNDIDTLHQLVGQALPNLLSAGVVVITVLSIMLWYSVWLTVLIVLGVTAMIIVSKTIGGRSAKYFIRQQRSIGAVEGFIQEMMTGQKVIKVFCHEEESKEDFDRVNNQMFEDARKAHRFANMLMPILNNIGNVLYVLVAMAGGLLLAFSVPNLSISGAALSISILVPFLNMTKQFSGNVSQVSNQLNSVIMALAGASRVFELLDEEPETDDGYVTLVNCTENPDGSISESSVRTGKWAWKHPHSADGSVTYTPLRGDVRLNEVDFSYVPYKPVLKNVTVFAEPGQKVAFVGATGAGKTTITNLINRFYDIEDGKIRYDGINIRKIKKADLRRSLGIVLQETNLFTGTVMENIRYGMPDATDEDCIAAARLVGADDFITRLPDGYNTMLTGNAASLSQGQRQLLAIARAAVADPPVMIMDEATSSIDTRTEAIVQRGMDALMKGRTVFVIAHRLSTVRNSDVIMVLDHGEIIERGNHEKLIAEKGTYYKLYTGAFELE